MVSRFILIDPTYPADNIDFEVDMFLSCEELLQNIRKSTIYHLIFVDIEFPTMNGVELGKIILLLLV